MQEIADVYYDLVLRVAIFAVTICAIIVVVIKLLQLLFFT